MATVRTWRRMAAAAGRLAAALRGERLVAVWATPTPETAVAVVAALLAGVPAVPLNPRSGEREVTHIVADSAPSLVLAGPGAELPPALAALPRRDITRGGAGSPPELPAEPGPESPALVVYTSGTTGPPKGAVLPRRAVAATVDALADAWRWTGGDVLVHALPLFHVRGLILGVLGPLRLGGAVHHLGRFTVEGVARGLGEGGGTMLFSVPTMYHRLAEALQADPADDQRQRLADALSGARLLVSGSAALPLHDHRRIAEATGRGVIGRYGMTETLMITAVRAEDGPRPGTVGVPLRGVELRVVGEDGREAAPGEVSEIQVRGPSLFTGYLGRPDATQAAFGGDGGDGWFRTGDMPRRDGDGALRLVGRRATDLIKSGGYKIGAGEIENALLEHRGVREAAVTGEPDADLGERVVAWVVPTDPELPPAPEELAGHVGRLLAPHKSPRAVRYLDALPRNAMGKVVKQDLADG